MITGVQDVYYNVSNMERALNFYGEVLGLEVDQRSEWWSALNVGGVHVGLHWSGGDSVPDVPGDDHGPHSGAQLTLRVDDITDTVRRLKEAGVNILGEIKDRPWGSLVAFRDPDGNYLTLMQPKAKAQAVAA